MVIAGNERPEMKLNEGQTFIAFTSSARKCVNIMESIGKHQKRVDIASRNNRSLVVTSTCRGCPMTGTISTIAMAQ